MADISPLPSPALATATLAAPHARGWWDTILALMVMALTNFWLVLPHLIQLGGGVIVALTVWEKVEARILLLRSRKKERSDDTR